MDTGPSTIPAISVLSCPVIIVKPVMLLKAALGKGDLQVPFWAV
jgi:hypothetical protein